jgi:hypothetical protein
MAFESSQRQEGLTFAKPEQTAISKIDYIQWQENFSRKALGKLIGAVRLVEAAGVDALVIRCHSTY